MIPQKLKKGCGSLVDHLALRVMSRLFVNRHRPELTAEALRRAYDARDFYTSAAREPERFYSQPNEPSPLQARPLHSLPAGQKVSLKGLSGYTPHTPQMQALWQTHTSNQTLLALWWRHFGKRRPAVICLHGWGGGWAFVEERAFGFKRLYDSELDVILMTLPFHALRADPPRNRAPVFPSTKVDITVEGAAQAIWDVRRLIRYLLNDQQCPAVAVVGWSLGGLVASLLTSLENAMTSVAVISPAVSLADVLWEHGEGHPERKRVEKAGYTRADLDKTWAIASPLTFKPKLPADRLLIIAGQGDRICLPEHAERLSRHWNRPRVRWYPGGHLLQFDRPGVLAELRSFLQKTLMRKIN